MERCVHLREDCVFNLTLYYILGIKLLLNYQLSVVSLIPSSYQAIGMVAPCHSSTNLHAGSEGEGRED